MTPLRSLTDDQLQKDLLALIHDHRRFAVQVLLHLNEVNRRELHLRLGYSSLFDYCKRRLGYHASSAARRLRAARCIRQHPEVLRSLNEGKLSPTAVSLIAFVITHENKKALLEEVERRPQNDIDDIIAKYKQGDVIRERVVPVKVIVKVTTPVSATPGV